MSKFYFETRLLSLMVDDLRTEEGVGRLFLPTYRRGREWMVSALNADTPRWRRHCLKRACECLLQAGYGERGIEPNSKADEALRGYHLLHFYVENPTTENLWEFVTVKFVIPEQMKRLGW